MGIGEIVNLVTGLFYLFDRLDSRGYAFPIISITIVSLLLLAGIGILIYITIKTMKLQKDETGMGDIVGKEAEVLSSSETLKGSKGWALINGENWKFSSRDKLKQGDIVKVISYKGMKLEVIFLEKEL